MKKVILSLLIAGVVSTGVAQAPAFPDIPAGHWASDAVTRLTDLGIIIGFPDNTFRGNESFTRYQAALVISRLLDVIAADMNAAMALTQADIEALRNALQELAADVAAQGAQIEGISSDVLSNTQRIEALEAAIDAAMGMSPDAVMALQNQLDQLLDAVASAQATADEAAALAAGNLALIEALSARVDQNSAEIDALNELVGLLNDDVLALTDSVSGFDGAIQRNANDIANIREFVILLRRNQVALDGRVTALEESDAEQDAAISALEARLTAVEEELITVSGEIFLEYTMGRFADAQMRSFDVDRVYGFGEDNSRVMTDNSLYGEGQGSTFSSDSDDLNEDDDEGDDGEEPEDREDFDGYAEGELGVELDLNLGFGIASGDPNQLNTFDVVLNLEVDGDLLDGGDEGGDNLDGGDDAQLAIDSVTTTFTPIGGDPLTFSFGEFGDAADNSPDVEFTPYVFELFYDDSFTDGGIFEDASSDGIVATAGSPDFLSFLNPTLTFAHGEIDVGYSDDFGDSDQDEDFRSSVRGDEGPVDPILGVAEQLGRVGAGTSTSFEDTYYTAIRGTMSPIDGFSGGVSFAQLYRNAGENAEINDDNVTTTVLGVDAQARIAFIDLETEFAFSSTDTGGLLTEAEEDEFESTVFYVVADIDGEGLPFLNSLTVNYRDIPGENIFGVNAWQGLEFDDDDYPFGTDQAGFKAAADLSIFILDVDGYFDYYEAGDDSAQFKNDGTPVEVTAFGVGAEANIFLGFSAYGFFEQVSIEGDAVDANDGGRTEGSPNDAGFVDFDDIYERDDVYETRVGGGLRHDGSADNALIDNLDLEAEFALVNAGLDTTNITVELDYSLDVSFINITPYFELDYTFGNPDSDAFDSELEFLVGTGIETEPLDIPLSPSLVGVVNYRSFEASDHNTDPANEDYTADEFQISAGVNFNRFFFDNSELTIRGGFYTSTNFENETNLTGEGDNATDISDGDANNGFEQETYGYEIIWNYYDLEIAWGAYENYRTLNDVSVEENSVQAFRVAYTVTF
ncbi:MAG: S-layer homology domain-containing protein [Deinococcota bacterium]